MDKHRQLKKEKLFRPERVDPYQDSTRHKGTALCLSCGASYQAGRWTWQALTGEPTEKTTCPACRRISDNAPAGEVQLTGAYVREHRDAILALIRHTEAAEKQSHALERLLKISEQADGLLVTTTGTHLANRIGHALDASHHGHSRYHYSDAETYLTVEWRRD